MEQETTYELNLDTFKGPLEKLLELIEEKRLEVTELALAEVTGDFLAYLEKLEHVSPRVLSDFLQIAARLILIKSKAILPQLELTEEEEESIHDLEYRLKLYREFRDAEKHISDLWQKEVRFAREYLLDFPKGFYLKEPLSPDNLRAIMEKMYEELSALIPKTESIEIKLVSLEEKIEELIRRVKETLRTKWSEISKGKEQSEIIVLFLALLHLLKERVIEIEQKEHFSEIEIFEPNYGNNA